MVLKIDENGDYIPYSRQQTFLGATIVNFTLNAGFEDSASSINVELVVDEFNKNDTTLLGFGQDIYHDGVADKFRPPPVGSPVFFAYGPSGYPITLHGSPQGYDISAFEDNQTLSFGGILQSYRKTQSATDGVRFSAVVNDPKEVLSNVQLIIRNFSGNTLGIPNLLNIYGYLEHNSSDIDFETIGELQRDGTGSDTELPPESIIQDTQAERNRIRNLPDSEEKTIQNLSLRFQADKSLIKSLVKSYQSETLNVLTGTGFSRQTDTGIPFYRIMQALRAFNFEYGVLPEEYNQYSNPILYRGFRYAFDFSNLPVIPPFYTFDYDNINILDFIMEVCEVANHDVFVDLHPVQKDSFFDVNSLSVDAIISLRTVDRSNPLPTNATHVKQIIENIPNPESTDVGYEMTDISTSKLVIGAQRVDPYIFKKNISELASFSHQRLSQMLKQAILPYYGLLSNGTVTIPKGIGPFKQIKLDSSSLAANGVGGYYIATEMELRHAKIGFKEWSDFLVSYDSKYLECFAGNDISDNLDFATSDEDGEAPGLQQENYAVTVPRCRFGGSAEEYYLREHIMKSYEEIFGSCNPRYGYPLYWNRATQIGLPQAGLAGLTDQAARLIKDLELIVSGDADATVIEEKIKKYFDLAERNPNDNTYTKLQKRVIEALKDAKEGKVDKAIVYDAIGDASVFLAVSKKLATKSLENAQKVHAFLQNIANECLGKKYLVKIPQRINTTFKGLKVDGTPSFRTSGPFGFPPPRTTYDLDRATGKLTYKEGANPLLGVPAPDYISKMNRPESFEPPYSYYEQGSLKVGKNPINDLFEYNYLPEPQGAFFNDALGDLKIYQENGWVPKDITTVSEEQRLQAYVRFDNSQEMSFAKVSDGVVKQMLTDNVLDGNLDGMSEIDKNLSITSSNKILEKALEGDGQTQSITFVKCTLDSKFYHAPKIEQQKKPASLGVKNPKTQLSTPKRVRNKNGEDIEVVKGSRLLFEPEDFSKSATVEDMVDSSSGVSSDHVYALITLPGQVELTQNNILGQKKQPGVLSYMHLLFEDAPKAVHADPGFDELGDGEGGPQSYPPNFNNLNYQLTYSKEIAGNDATAAEKKVYEGVTFASHRINIAAPSPITPDYVILPLLSKERCYGPWSTRIAYGSEDFDTESSDLAELEAAGLSNTQLGELAGLYPIGGKVEFSKDESIAPWNFNGYENMNRYGDGVADFESPPRLFSELGSFTVPEAPVGGYSLGTQIGPAGSLITNISVNISPDSIRSTYQLATYTQGFGKLKKQNQDKLKLISRQQAKMKDAANLNIKKGIAKGKNDINYQMLYDSLRRNSDYGDYGRDQFNSPMSINAKSNLQISTVVAKSVVAEDENEAAVEVSEISNQTSDMSSEDFSENAATLAQHPDLYSRQFGNSAIDEKGKNKVPVSLEGFHHAMPHNDISAMDSVDYDDGIDNVVNNDYYDT